VDAPPRRIGTTIGGRYRIESRIARGGMSTVYLGVRVPGGGNVAVKVFHGALADDASLVKRFLNEAVGTSRLNHPNIVDILDMGMDEENIPFFVMELLDGEPLSERLRRPPFRLGLKETTDIMLQVLTGLQAAHGRGITHRDLKPSNIFLARAPDGTETAKILDFGIARFREFENDGREKLTITGTVLGTPEYMSLEQARAQRDLIDHRSDLYACGVILYRCLTGISPMKGKNRFETVRNVYKRSAPPPSTAAPNVPPQVDPVVMKAMERERALRYQDCGSFIEALRTFYEIDFEIIPEWASMPVAISEEETQELADSMPGSSSVAPGPPDPDDPKP